MEDGEGVLSFIHASGGQDDGDEVDTGVSEERERGGLGQEFDIHIGDVAHDVVVVIYHGQGGNAFV